MIDEVNFNFIKKHGAFMMQNRRDEEQIVRRDLPALTAKGELVKKKPVMTTYDQIISQYEPSKKIFDKRDVKKIPKNYFFKLTDEFYDLSLKEVTSNNYTIIPSIKARLLRTTGFDLEELESLKELFLEYSTKHRGIDYDNFLELIQELYGFRHHPFAGAIFNQMDEKKDGLIDYVEFVEAMSIIYKGNLSQKSKFCFDMLDCYSKNTLSLAELNELFQIAYVEPLENIKYVYTHFNQINSDGETIGIKDLFKNRELMERWEKGFDIVTDRMEKIRFYVSAIQKNYRFNLLNMEEL